jgi:hypothetical protein
MRPDGPLAVKKADRMIGVLTFPAFAMLPLSLAGDAGARIWPSAIRA